jgi:hypothetical protein
MTDTKDGRTDRQIVLDGLAQREAERSDKQDHAVTAQHYVTGAVEHLRNVQALFNEDDGLKFQSYPASLPDFDELVLALAGVFIEIPEEGGGA